MESILTKFVGDTILEASALLEDSSCQSEGPQRTGGTLRSSWSTNAKSCSWDRL